VSALGSIFDRAHPPKVATAITANKTALIRRQESLRMGISEFITIASISY
jgi:hypothetical protein